MDKVGGKFGGQPLFAPHSDLPGLNGGNRRGLREPGPLKPAVPFIVPPQATTIVRGPMCEVMPPLLLQYTDVFNPLTEFDGIMCGIKQIRSLIERMPKDSKKTPDQYFLDHVVGCLDALVLAGEQVMRIGDPKSNSVVDAIVDFHGLIEKQLSAFEIEEIEVAIGETFDPSIHNKTDVVNSPIHSSPPNTITNFNGFAYKYKGRILRPASVIIYLPA